MSKLPNLYAKKRGGYVSYYYRYKKHGRTQPMIPLGNSRKNTMTQIKARYVEAQTKVWNMMHGIVTEAPISQVEKQVLLHEIYPRFIAETAPHHGKTFLRDTYNMKSFIEFFGDVNHWTSNPKTGGKVSRDCKIDLAKITTADINNFYASDISGKSTSTKKSRNIYLKPLWEWLVVNELVDKDVYALKHKLGKQGNKSMPHQVLKREDILKIISLTSSHKHKVFWTIMAYTGLAPIDAGSLTKDDIVLNGTFECIVKSRNKTNITAQIPIVGKLKKIRNFITNLNMSKNERDAANTEFKALAKQIGIKQREGHILAQYCLRHSLATFLRTYLTDNEIKMYMGHTNTKQQQTYISLEASKLHDKMADALK
tara:strand:+ start:402 stop:1508 length:1107 start_codon:yes stop_codon:yes gene_type:complete